VIGMNMKVVPKSKPKAAGPSFTEHDVLELKVSLKNCETGVERTVLVRADITFGMLHYILQVAMGWGDHHLHEFKLGKTRVGMEQEYDFFADDEVLLEEDHRLFELLSACNGKFVYWYDFGDDWMHDIKAKVIPPAKAEGKKLPTCRAGTGACPPEDCGGVWGYAEMLEDLRTGSKTRKEELREWLGGKFDPEAFDLKAVDRALGHFR